jgi:hypothetical protein
MPLEKKKDSLGVKFRACLMLNDRQLTYFEEDRFITLLSSYLNIDHERVDKAIDSIRKDLVTRVRASL